MEEIERKFLFTSIDFIAQSNNQNRIVQGYLNSNPSRNVRVRIKGAKGFLTIKGKGNASGTTRFEWETEIAVAEAELLLQLCEKGIIDKIRYEILVGKHTFEVDVFSGENQGLVMAEVELSEENEFFEKPKWLGIEVTGDKRYFNSYLSENPFTTWP